MLNEEHLLLPHSTTLIGGDFNALRAPQLRGRGVHPPILSWARQTGLLHVFSSLGLPQIPTYYSGSTPKYEIDHILMSADSHLLPSRGIVLDDVAWGQETDHRPVVADFHVPGYAQPHRPRWKRRKRRELVVDIDRTNVREVSLFQRAMKKKWRPLPPIDSLSIHQLNNRLHRIHSDTFTAAHTICSHSRRGNGNWSPHTTALRLRLGAILSMGRVLSRPSTSSPVEKLLHIRKVCTRWRRHLSGLNAPDEATVPGAPRVRNGNLSLWTKQRWPSHGNFGEYGRNYAGAKLWNDARSFNK